VVEELKRLEKQYKKLGQKASLALVQDTIERYEEEGGDVLLEELRRMQKDGTSPAPNMTVEKIIGTLLMESETDEDFDFWAKVR
jgi:hypothetical protein